MPISKNKALYLLVCATLDFLFVGGVRTVIGKQDVYTFLGVFTLLFLLHNSLWSWVKKLPTLDL